MNALTTLLYWISSGMLIPVIILILIAFGYSLLLLGDLYGIFSQRLRGRKDIKQLMQEAADNPVSSINYDKLIKQKTLLGQSIMNMKECGWHPIHGKKILSEFELAANKDLKMPKTLMRIGPMLGLMGTLIPMGPALAGLASGDIASMATNMQVAFSTTVIGVFIGGLGFVVQLAKSHWNQADYACLAYIFELSQDQQNEKKQKTCLCA